MNIEEMLPYISAPITGVVTYFATRSRNKKELKSLDVGNQASTSDVVSKNLELYQNIIDDIEERYKEREKTFENDIISLKVRIDELNHQNKKLTKFINDIQAEREEETALFEAEIKKLREKLNAIN